jgi:hypothetical protein
MKMHLPIKCIKSLKQNRTRMHEFDGPARIHRVGRGSIVADPTRPVLDPTRPDPPEFTKSRPEPTHLLNKSNSHYSFSVRAKVSTLRKT